jgi:hypothetical protein
VALPARSDSDELQKENNKSVAALKGQAVFSIAKVGYFLTPINPLWGLCLDIFLCQTTTSFNARCVLDQSSEENQSQ